MQMVLTRELQANSRRPQTYHRRLIAAGCAVAILFLFALFESPRQTGAPLFYTILTIAFFVCSFEAINRSCSSITTEKEEGTLGLLLLTRLTGHELLAGKFLAAIVASMQPVFAILPALAIPIFMGGITGRDFAAASLALIHAVLIWLGAGVACSAIAKTTFEASVQSVIGVVFLGGFLVVLAQIGGLFLAFNPVTPILLLVSPRGIQPWHVFTSMLVTAACIILILRGIGKSLANDWRAETTREATLSFPTPPPAPAPVTAPIAREENPTVPSATEKPSPRWFEGNPIAWLVVREAGMHGNVAARIVFTSVLAACTLVHFGFGFFLGWILVLLLALVAPSCAARARRASALELWLTTPLTEDEIRAGYYKGLRQIFAWPAAIIFGATALRILIEAYIDFDRFTRFALVVFYQFAMMLLAFSVVARLGFSMGLKSASPLAASLKSVFFGIILPWILLPIPNFIYYPILGTIAHSGTLRLRERVTRRDARP